MVQMTTENWNLRSNQKLVNKCGFRFPVRASEQTEPFPQNQDNAGFWAQIARNRYFYLACSSTRGCCSCDGASASKRRGITFKGFEGFYLNAKVRIWPWLSYQCHIPWTAISHWAATGAVLISHNVSIERRNRDFSPVVVSWYTR